MALTKEFKETVKARTETDPKFRQALLAEAVNEFLADNTVVAKAILRDYIKATTSFEPLAKKVAKNSKSIQRMLSPSGNPTTNSLFAILYEIQKLEGITFTVNVHKSV